ncbi:MAG: hypothetical protein ACW98D_17185 [Promethearchaeota archaeon]|jgi:hypothetical protein
MDNQEQINRIEEIIGKLDSKDFKLYFFALDTKGNPVAGVANIYEHVRILNELGYNALIMHEKNDYQLNTNENGLGVDDWLGAEYAELPHISIEDQKLNVKPEDFIFIPEVFSTIMDQVKAFPCKKVVISQSPQYMFELLPIGKRWNRDYGFNDVITTSESQASYVKNHFPAVKTHVVPVGIADYFVKSDKPQKPIIAILSRDQSDTAKIAKSFYLQYPLYKWLTFKDMRGMPRATFAKELSECCLAVWVDEKSGFGTFPLEAMECGVPVIGKMPDMIPEWMITKDEEGNESVKNNGVWTNTLTNVPELISTYIKLFLEDNVPTEMIENMETTTGVYTIEAQKAAMETVYAELVSGRIKEIDAMRPEEKVVAEDNNTEEKKEDNE